MFIPGCERRIIHKKLGFMVRVSYCTGVSADSFKDVIDFKFQITEQLLLSPTQARSFFGSYWRGSE